MAKTLSEVMVEVISRPRNGSRRMARFSVPDDLSAAEINHRIAAWVVNSQAEDADIAELNITFDSHHSSGVLGPLEFDEANPTLTIAGVRDMFSPTAP